MPRMRLSRRKTWTSYPEDKGRAPKTRAAAEAASGWGGAPGKGIRFPENPGMDAGQIIEHCCEDRGDFGFGSDIRF
jgi:hypothetical protein